MESGWCEVYPFGWRVPKQGSGRECSLDLLAARILPRTCGPGYAPAVKWYELYRETNTCSILLYHKIGLDVQIYGRVGEIW